MNAIIKRICPICKETYEMDGVDAEKLAKVGTVLIQELFPDYNPLEREFIKTGYCPACQELLFGTSLKSDKIRRCA